MAGLNYVAWNEGLGWTDWHLERELEGRTLCGLSVPAAMTERVPDDRDERTCVLCLLAKQEREKPTRVS